MGQIKLLTDFDDNFFRNKRIFVRVDFNVKVKDDAISEDYRIRSAVPTIEYLVKRGSKVILGSHLDRPDGKDMRYSLKPVSKKLGEMLSSFNATVRFCDDCVGPTTNNMVDRMEEGEVLLLENLRFYHDEEKNANEFSEKLASYADIYVNDAFSTSHRKHSSTYGIAKYFDNRLAGFNLAQELRYLTQLRENPANPFTLVIGGVKIKDKIGALDHLLPIADKVLVGGAASYTFLKAKGYSIGDSIIEEDYLPWVTKALQAHSEKIILPLDHKVAQSENDDQYQIVQTDIPHKMRGFDIGDKTIQKFSYEIHNNGLGTIFWNGPMGFFEKEIYSNGTKSVAVSMALAYWRGVKTLIGGGDTLEAMRIAGVSEKEVTHVSTGGGASLRFLAGDEMPGIDILREK